jgi:succinate dehydrogenase / fumarate reductase flavoprotein subunit
MQGLRGYFVILIHLLIIWQLQNQVKLQLNSEAFKKVASKNKEMIKKLLNINGTKTVDEIHKQLGRIMWDKVGMARTEKGLKEAIEEIRKLRSEFWTNVKVVGESEDLNQTLERAGRLADYLELGELMALDALDRNESCGGHFRVEYQTEEGEALRNDDEFAYVSAWEFNDLSNWTLHKEPLNYEFVKLAQRSYK